MLYTFNRYIRVAFSFEKVYGSVQKFFVTGKIKVDIFRQKLLQGYLL